MTEDLKTVVHQRLYRIWISYIIGEDSGRKEIRCDVIADDPATAFQAVMRQHPGVDVQVTTVEQLAAMDRVILVDHTRQVLDVKNGDIAGGHSKE